MRIVDLIRLKRDGGKLPAEAIQGLIAGVAAGTVPEYQTAAWLMATYFRGLDAEETTALARAMLHSGRVLGGGGNRVRADKHSTGGVGDKTSLIVVPLAAAAGRQAGLQVPMICGRGLGHTGGTLDKLESIPGFRTGLSLEEFERVLERQGCAMIGATEEIAPADRKLYALRDVTATVENSSLITASILSKKLAEGLDVLVLDVKCGAGAFMKDLDAARRLAESLVRIGGEMGVRVQALVTDMEQPLGTTVGNALEVEECLEILAGGSRLGAADSELVELSLELAARMVALADPDPPLEAALTRARLRVQSLLASGEALKVFRAMAEEQGAEAGALERPWRLPRARFEREYCAPRAGYITGLNAFEIGQAAMLLGAGRAQLDSAIDPTAGLRLLRRVSCDAVVAGEPLCRLYYNDPAKLDAALARVREAIRIGDEPPPRRRLILGVVS